MFALLCLTRQLIYCRAWHSIKYLDPAESGAVIPILHVNGFKISERTIFGCMDNKELVALFSGYGYKVCIVERLKDINVELYSAMNWALKEVKSIQNDARRGTPITKPRWPMIILRTPKGWTGPRVVDDQLIEGSFHAHQIPVGKANSDKDHLRILQDWLQTYNARELLANGLPAQSLLKILPMENSKKLGQVKSSYDSYQSLDLPNWKPYSMDKPGEASSMQLAGLFLNEVAKKNKHTFRVFSPDELESNRLSGILKSSGRNFQWDQYSRTQGGRVIEMLSEHCCQGFMQGYTLTGRTSIFPSYESFLGIIHTMMVQFAKFSKIASALKWRGDCSSINYIETSTWARQEHNGFSHQNPSFIGAVLNVKADTARVCFQMDILDWSRTCPHYARRHAIFSGAVRLF